MNEQYGRISGRLVPGAQITGDISGRGKIRGGIDKPENVYVRELTFDSRFNFPAVGDPAALYIATDENLIYRYDNENNCYVRVSNPDWQEIDIIDGGNANGE